LSTTVYKIVSSDTIMRSVNISITVNNSRCFTLSHHHSVYNSHRSDIVFMKSFCPCKLLSNSLQPVVSTWHGEWWL